MAANDADILIVGAGAAGCVLARRLAERTVRVRAPARGRRRAGRGAAPDGFRLGKPADWGFDAEPGTSVARTHACAEVGCSAEPRG